MDKESFIELLRGEVQQYKDVISCVDGSWAVKGFIDVYRRIYTISADTKVISKIIELYIFPKLFEFAHKNNMEIILADEQNFYPDITFRDCEGHLYAVDLKSSYRKDENHINGMTLGAFTGYFRDRDSTKNITKPFTYGSYLAHVVLGVIYTPVKNVDECHSYDLEDLDKICSVVKDFQFFVQEKWKLAIDRPGSGNTKNIGSVSRIADLLNGNGVFADLGEEVFDDYWRHYLTNDMAKAAELEKPYYTNLTEYKSFKHLA